MAKNVHIGVGGVARKVKTPYIGVGGAAKAVKSGYVGVGGVARRFYVGAPDNYLYYQGNECVEASGGWESGSWKDGAGVVPVMTKNVDNIHVGGSVTTGSEKYMMANLYTKKVFDFSKYSTLYITYKLSAQGTKRQSTTVTGPEANDVGILAGVNTGSWLAKTSFENDGTVHTLALDISSVSSGGFCCNVGVYAYVSRTASIDLTIYNVWAE